MIQPTEKELAILDSAAQAIFDKKGVNILVLDVRASTDRVDYMILAEGSAEVHVRAIAKEVLAVLQAKGETSLFVEGMEYGDWVVLDATWLAVHIFLPGMREKYALERLWPDAEVVDVHILPSASRVI